MPGRPAAAVAEVVQRTENDIAVRDWIEHAWADVQAGVPHDELVRRHGGLWHYFTTDIEFGKRRSRAFGWGHFTKEDTLRAEQFRQDAGSAVPVRIITAPPASEIPGEETAALVAAAEFLVSEQPGSLVYAQIADRLMSLYHRLWNE